MKIIPLSSIIIPPNRQRKEFEEVALMELAESIHEVGLMHPPVVRQLNGETLLVAGERRMRAVALVAELYGSYPHGVNEITGKPIQVPATHIPVTDIGELDPIAAEEAELDENLRRKDLTWEEHAAALLRLQNLRVAQATAKGETHTVQQLAEEVVGRSDGGFGADVRQELIVARNLDNPVIAGAKSVKEAFKALQADDQRKSNERLAATVGASFNASMHSLYQKNCLEIMRLPAMAESIDVILTDPPYGMGADDFGDGGGKLVGNVDHQYDDSYESWQALMAAWCPLSFTIAKPQAHAYVFCDFDRFHELKLLMGKAGWYVFRTPLVVHKLNSGRVPLPDRGPRRSWEICLYAIKGNKPVTHIYPDVIPCKGDEQLGHGAQKPVELFVNLLQRSVRPGDKVFDGFAGTGTIFPAAHSLHVKAIGCEMVPSSFGIAAKRLADLKESP